MAYAFEIIVEALEACGRAVSSNLNLASKYDYSARDLNAICAHVDLIVVASGVDIYIDDEFSMHIASDSSLLNLANRKKLYRLLTSLMLDA